jgi:hypothetical protein
MQLSIRDASRFFVGAAMLRDQVAASTGQEVSISEIGASILNGDKLHLQETIDTLTKDEPFRKTPPHILASERVIQTRHAECRASRSLHDTVLSAVEHGELARKNDTKARGALEEAAITALEHIDQAPGSVAERQQMLGELKRQMNMAADDPLFVSRLMSDAEHAYNEQYFNMRLEKYMLSPVEHSTEYDSRDAPSL